jgi:hypothetical protein
MGQGLDLMGNRKERSGWLHESVTIALGNVQPPEPWIPVIYLVEIW